MCFTFKSPGWCSPCSPCSLNLLHVLPSVMAGWNNLWSPDTILCWLSKNHNICVWRTWSWVTQKCGALNLFWMKWRICACLSQLYCKIWVKRWIVGEKNRRRKEKKVFMWKCAQCNLASVCRWGPRGKSCYRRADLASTARLVDHQQCFLWVVSSFFRRYKI